MRPLKILHLVQKSQLRGAEVFTTQLASHINKIGHEAFIVCLFRGNVDLPFTGQVMHLNGEFKKRLYDIKAWKRLATIIKDQKPDVIQANAGDTLKYAVMSKLLFRWKQPIVFRNASTISLYIKNKPLKLYNALFFKYAERVISVSNTSAKDFAKLYPKYKNRIVTIPIGIEDNPIVKPKSIQAGDSPTLVHVGGFSFEKNHKGLLSIFEVFLSYKPTATLHLVGSGPLEKEVKELVQVKALNEKVLFHGFQKNAMDYIAKADVLLLPSIIEGLPGVILEAFYCRTPVVAYNVGGISEIVINNETGRLIEKGKEKDFASAILDALNINEANGRLLDNAYHLVTEKYMNDQIARRFLQVYESLIT